MGSLSWTTRGRSYVAKRGFPPSYQGKAPKFYRRLYGVGIILICAADERVQLLTDPPTRERDEQLRSVDSVLREALGSPTRRLLIALGTDLTLRRKKEGGFDALGEPWPHPLAAAVGAAERALAWDGAGDLPAHLCWTQAHIAWVRTGLEHDVAELTFADQQATGTAPAFPADLLGRRMDTSDQERRTRRRRSSFCLVETLPPTRDGRAAVRVFMGGKWVADQLLEPAPTASPVAADVQPREEMSPPPSTLSAAEYPILPARIHQGTIDKLRDVLTDTPRKVQAIANSAGLKSRSYVNTHLKWMTENGLAEQDEETKSYRSPHNRN